MQYTRSRQPCTQQWCSPSTHLLYDSLLTQCQLIVVFDRTEFLVGWFQLALGDVVHLPREGINLEGTSSPGLCVPPFFLIKTMQDRIPAG